MKLYDYTQDGNYHAVSLLKNPKQPDQWLLCLDMQPIRSYKRYQDAKASATKRKNKLIKNGILREEK